MGPEVDRVGEGDLASAKWGAAVAHELGYVRAGVARVLVRIRDHRQDRAFKTKEVVGSCSRLKGDGQSGKWGCDSARDLLDVVDVERGSATVRERLRHDDEVGAARAGGDAKVKQKRVPSARYGGYGIDFSGVRSFELDFDDGSDGLGRVDVHRKHAGARRRKVERGYARDFASGPLVSHIDFDNLCHVGAAVSGGARIRNNRKRRPVVADHACGRGFKVEREALGHRSRCGNGEQ